MRSPAVQLTPPGSPTETPNLDLLRALAVLSVLADHTLQVMGIFHVGPFGVTWLGLFGVYIFFLHTSLVLMWSLERRPHTLDFYIRRAFRIYPLAIFTIAAVLLLRIPAVGDADHPFAFASHQPLTVITNLLLVQNLFHRPPVELVLWSLPLEVQMYLVLPMLYLFARKERTLWPLLILWGFATLAGRALSGASESNIVTCVPFFLCGVIAYIGFMRRTPRLPSWLLLPTSLVLACVYAAHPTLYSGWVACLILAIVLPSFRQVVPGLWARSGHALAKYSYGIYLLHQCSIALAFHFLHVRSLAVKLLVELASLAILAALAYHFIEHPMIEMGKRVAAKIQRTSPEPALHY